jgi:hypothetical protein
MDPARLHELAASVAAEIREPGDGSDDNIEAG